MASVLSGPVYCSVKLLCLYSIFFFQIWGIFLYYCIQNGFSVFDQELSFYSACNLLTLHFLACSICAKATIFFAWTMQFLFLVFKPCAVSSTWPFCWWGFPMSFFCLIKVFISSFISVPVFGSISIPLIEFCFHILNCFLYFVQLFVFSWFPSVNHCTLSVHSDICVFFKFLDLFEHNL